MEHRMVWPSGSARATSAAPIEPEAPALFSMTTVFPTCLVMKSPKARERNEWHLRLPYSERWKITRPAREATQPSTGGGAYETYCCRDCNCTGARACALACFGGSVDTGLRAGLATRGGGLADVAADVFRRFCSEALAIVRAICSWLALSCSAVLAFSRANSSWLALSCPISCCTLARSRAIVWSDCVTSGGIGTGAASCGAV